MSERNKDLRALFLHGLKDINYTEHALLSVLPRLAAASMSPVLRKAFERHARQTETHVERLDRVFGLLDERSAQLACDAIQGLIRESKDIEEDFKGGAALDAGLIAAAQAVEHYEIARYGALKAWAEQLDFNEISTILGATLAEEKETDGLLTQLASEKANPAGAHAAV